MEKPHIPAPDSDPEFRSELTRTFVSNGPGTFTEWTNEKQRSYINSLETSFVNNLLHSRRSHPQIYVQGTNPSQDLPFKTYNSFDKFNVVQDRRFQKIISPNNETLLGSTADSNSTMERPCMDHVVSCYKGTQLRRKPTSEHLGIIARTSKQNPACHQDSIGSTAEISGQNFMDENHSGKLNCEVMPKWLKRASADASSNDQLVPFGNYDTKEVSMVHNASSEREEQGHHQLLLEQRKRFIRPKLVGS